MTRPSLTKRVVNGMAELVELAAADVESDPTRWPKSHDIHRGIEYIRKLTAWWEKRRGGS